MVYLLVWFGFRYKYKVCLLGADYMENFSPGWVSAGLTGLKLQPGLTTKSFKNWRCDYMTDVIAKHFQPRLKIHKRMRRTPVHNNKYKKATVPALTFIFKPSWNFPCNRVLARTEIWSCNRPLRNMGVRWQDKARKYFSKSFNDLGLKIMHSQIQPENCELFGRNSKSLSWNVLHIQKECVIPIHINAKSNHPPSWGSYRDSHKYQNFNPFLRLWSWTRPCKFTTKPLNLVDTTTTSVMSQAKTGKMVKRKNRPIGTSFRLIPQKWKRSDGHA